MRFALGLTLFWILGVLTFSFAFFAVRGLFADMSLHVLDSTDFAVLLTAVFGIPCLYVWRFLIATR